MIESNFAFVSEGIGSKKLEWSCCITSARHCIMIEEMKLTTQQ